LEDSPRVGEGFVFLDGAEQATRQKDDGGYQIKSAMHGNADESKRQQQQPDEGISDQCEQGQRPAKDEEDTPEKKFDHRAMNSFARLEDTRFQVKKFRYQT
jgi:hypothetical protein